MKRNLIGVLLGLALSAPSSLLAQSYERSVVVPPIKGAAPGVTPHGITGISFGKDGKLYAGSVLGPGVYRIDVKTGTLDQVVGAPDGESDDVFMAPDGSLVWTALLSGELRTKRPNGKIEVLAKDLPMINPVTVTSEGRLVTGQMAKPDSLIEVDLAGKKPLRTIATDLGGINAFEEDGGKGNKAGLYVPLAEKGAIGRVDLATGELKIIATDLGMPVSVKRDAHGGLVTLDWSTGKVSHVNPETGETKRIASVTPPLDNLAVGADDTIYVSRPSDSSIIAINPTTGNQTPLIEGHISAGGGLAVIERNGKAALVLSDAYGHRFVDLASGAIDMLPFEFGSGASSDVAVTSKNFVFTNSRRPTLTVVDRATNRTLNTVTGFKTLMNVVATESGEIYVTDYGSGEIVSVKPGATPDRSVVLAGLQGPVGLAMDKTGSLIVGEATAGAISRVDIKTGIKTLIANDLAQPEGLTLLPNGKIAVAEVGARRLTLVNPANGAHTVIAENIYIGATFTRAPAPVYLPTGVTVDASGAIYVTCDMDNSVLKFTPQSQ